MPNFSGLGSAIKSIQYVTNPALNATGGTAQTISSVNPNKSIFIPTTIGMSYSSGGVSAQVTGATTLTWTSTLGATLGSGNLNGYIVEFA